MRFSPALLTAYEPARLRFPCFAQPKLNGFRAIYRNGQFYSRSGNRWADSLLTHISAQLRSKLADGITLDGELYRHGWTLDRIAEAVSLFRREPSADTYEVGFYVFDIYQDAPFPARWKHCRRGIGKRFSFVQLVPLHEIDCADSADAVYNLHLTAGFEGTVYRIGDHGYRPGRDKYLMKRKPKPGSGFTEDRLELMRERKPTEFRQRTSRWHSIA